MISRAVRREVRPSANRVQPKAQPRIEALEDRLVPTGGLTLNQSYVTQLYTDLLQRVPDQQGIDYWSSKLDQGMTRSECAGQVIHSDEALTHTLDKYYEQYLGRHADDRGKEAFLPLLRSGDVNQVQARLLSSPEYATTNGIQNLSDLLAHVYVDVLGRPAESGAQSFFANKQFANNSLAIATMVLNSPEACEREIKNSYLQFLEREPDVSGVTFWRDGLAKECNALTLAQAILGSDEYFQTPHANDDTVEIKTGQSAQVNVAANDVRLFGRQYEVELVKNPTNGVAAVREDGSIIYVPQAGFTGTDVLTYRLHTDAGMSSIGILTVTVNPLN
jgi:hypothetical protein